LRRRIGLQLLVIGHHDDERIVAAGREILGHLHGVIQHDRIVDGPLPIE
jgi:hypothetical protein